MTHLLDQAPRGPAGPPESALKTKTLHRIRQRGGWAFPTTGVAIVGTPDIVGAYRSHPLALELKKPKGRTTPKQDRELARARAAGAHAHVVRSLADLDHILDTIDKETPTWTSPS